MVLIYSNSVWGFFVALLMFIFQNASRKVCISLGAATGVVSISVAWCIINTWASGEEEIDYPYGPGPQVGDDIHSSLNETNSPHIL